MMDTQTERERVSEMDSAFSERYIPMKSSLLPRRYVMVLLTGFSFLIIHWMRKNIVTAIVHVLVTHSYTTTLYPKENDWTISEVQIMTAASTIGFLIGQIPGSIIVLKFPANRVFAVSVALSSFFHMMIPLTLNHEVASAATLNVLQGLAEGPLYPAFYSLITRWTPPDEKFRMIGIAYSGIYFGSAMSYLVGFNLAEAINEEASFYISAILGFLSSILCVNYLCESPSEDPMISESELQALNKDMEQEFKAEIQIKEIPFKLILKSASFWAIALVFLSHVCINIASQYSPMLLLWSLPGYSSADIVSSIRVAIFPLMILASGWLADYITYSGLLSKLWTRRCFLSGTLVLYCCINVALFFMKASLTSYILIYVGVGISGISIAGAGVNFLDVCPRYIAVVVALVMTLSTLTENVIFISVHYLIPVSQEHGWKVFIYVSTVFSFAAAVAFGVFSSAERAEWDKCDLQHNGPAQRNDAQCYPKNDEECDGIFSDDASSV